MHVISRHARIYVTIILIELMQLILLVSL